MPPLLSGNGRHRRPRQAPNFVVAAGVTGAGLAIPLLGATSASAADNPTWDAVAECESGGLWSADEDNGYYGGLQLDQETWESYGGTEYAERPDLASRDQQISVAESILDEEGAGTFGECAESAGLSQESPGEPDVDPDGSEEVADGPVAERPYPPYPSDGAPEEEGGASDGEEPADPSESADPAESGDSGDDSAGGSGDGSSDSRTPRARPTHPTRPPRPSRRAPATRAPAAARRTRAAETIRTSRATRRSPAPVTAPTTAVTPPATVRTDTRPAAEPTAATTTPARTRVTATATEAATPPPNTSSPAATRSPASPRRRT